MSLLEGSGFVHPGDCFGANERQLFAERSCRVGFHPIALTLGSGDDPGHEKNVVARHVPFRRGFRRRHYPMNWTPLNLTVRVGCNLAYETSVQTPVLFVLKPRLEGRVLVMQERLSFGIGLPSYEFQDSHGNITYRSTFMPGRNEIRHDALVAFSSLPDSREIFGNIIPVGQLPHELLRYTLPSRYCDSDKLMNFAWNQLDRKSTRLNSSHRCISYAVF